MSDLGTRCRDGLPGASHANGQPVMASMRRITADSGSAFVTAATVALGVQAAGLLYVSFAAQYAYILREKPGQRAPSVIEALMLDTGMIIFSFLALGLAKKGLSSRAERALILLCAGLSAAMNYAASDTTAWRSVAVYVIAPVFLAVVTDRVIAAVRRHGLGPGEASAWATLGRALAAAIRTAGTVLLYLLRFALAPPSTAAGLRRCLLAATPLPGPGQHLDIARCVTSESARAAATGSSGVPDPVRASGLPALPTVAPKAAGTALNGRAHPTATAGGPAGPPQQRRPPGEGLRAVEAGAEDGEHPAAGPATDDAIEAYYTTGPGAGQVPSGKTIRREWHLGSTRARHIHARLTARRLARLTADQIAAAVATLSADVLGEVRGILAAQLPGLGSGFGPNTDAAYQACTAALDAGAGVRPVTGPAVSG